MGLKRIPYFKLPFYKHGQCDWLFYKQFVWIKESLKLSSSIDFLTKKTWKKEDFSNVFLKQGTNQAQSQMGAGGH